MAGTGEGVTVPWSRRDFLRLAAGAATLAATGAACSSESDKPKQRAGAGQAAAGKGDRTLRIAQWNHFVPAYDTWFDGEYTQRWGEEHGVKVLVDHISATELSERATAEVAAQRGHDLFGFLIPVPAFEDEVIDHREIVEEVRAKLGPMVPFLERGVLNPKNGRYYGFPDHWAPLPVVYRADVWGELGQAGGPGTWDDVLKAAPGLKAAGHPVGFAFSSDVDANWSLESLMLAYGSSLQDESGNLTINRPATVEAVKAATALYQAGMLPEVLNWDAAANNRFLASGRGSMTLNSITVVRAVEKQDPDLARQLALAPALAGPANRLGVGSQSSNYGIWRFAENQELAKQFLVDLALNSREAFLHSESVNLPAFPAAVKDLSQLLAGDAKGEPAGKYAPLAQAAEWTTNIGHPGTVNAAVDEVFNQYLLPKMFAAAARGEMSAEESVKAAEAQITPIDKWRERGKV
jgi:multiple sugar transport system substrate-binding protein